MNCSKECAKKSRKKRQQSPEGKEYHKKYNSLYNQNPENKEKAKECLKRYRQNHKAPPTIKNCVVCGTEFETNHGTKMNCSKECSKKHTHTSEYRKKYYENRDKILLNAKKQYQKKKN